MKRRIITILAALVLALFPLGAFAQTTVATSGFQVLNMGSADANITIVYYNQDGSEAGRQQDVIARENSKTYIGATMQVSAGFQGSVVISSDQPVIAITNLLNSLTVPQLADSYSGFSGGATTVNLPLIQRGNGGINSWITVQNAGSADATVNVAYSPGLAGSAATDTATIKPGAARTFYQKGKDQLGTRFVGSAKITTNGQPVVAIVNQENDDGKSLLTYGGLATNGSTTVAAPLVAADNFGSFTGIQILNTSASDTTATITYGANTVTDKGTAAAVCPAPSAKQYPIPAGKSVTVIQSGLGGESDGFDPQFANCRYVGSATISASQTLAVIVNQASLNGSNGSSYAGVDPSATGQSVSAPLINANNYGIYTGIQVQNTGNAATTVTITYGANTATAEGVDNNSATSVCPTLSPTTFTLDAGKSYTLLQGGNGPADLGFDQKFNKCLYIGSAVVSAASGGQITAIVNQVSPSGGDGLLTYSAFTQ
jgi:hypothetical protein